MTLGQQIDRLLALMSVVSHGRSGRAPDAPQVSTGKFGASSGPTMPGDSLFDRWTRPDSDLNLVLVKMERDLKRVTHSPGSIERKEDRDKRIVAQYVGCHASKVAVFEDMSAQAVRDLRKKAGVDQSRGH